jgi:hypothetical protein
LSWTPEILFIIAAGRFANKSGFVQRSIGQGIQRRPGASLQHEAFGAKMLQDIN